MTAPLTTQYFMLEVTGLNLTDITWPENNKFFLPFKLSLLSSILHIHQYFMVGRYSLPVIQFSLVSLEWSIWTPSMLNLLKFAFKISFSRSSWPGCLGKSNFCAKTTFSIKFALQALLPIETPRWRRYFRRSSTFHFYNFSSVKYIIKKLKVYILILMKKLTNV